MESGSKAHELWSSTLKFEVQFGLAAEYRVRPSKPLAPARRTYTAEKSRSSLSGKKARVNNKYNRNGTPFVYREMPVRRRPTRSCYEFVALLAAAGKVCAVDLAVYPKRCRSVSVQ